jgi:hypothetical protein
VAGALGSQLYHFHVPIVSKSVGLNLLEPSGPVQGLLTFITQLNNKYASTPAFYGRTDNRGAVVRYVGKVSTD